MVVLARMVQWYQGVRYRVTGDGSTDWVGPGVLVRMALWYRPRWYCGTGEDGTSEDETVLLVRMVFLRIVRLNRVLWYC